MSYHERKVLYFEKWQNFHNHTKPYQAAHCLTFIGQKYPSFIQNEILPNFPENALIKEKYVLLLAQFIIMEGFVGYEICQKLVYMIRDHQLERTWDRSILGRFLYFFTRVKFYVYFCDFYDLEL